MGDPADQAGIYDEPVSERFRITIRPSLDGKIGGVELRGYLDSYERLRDLADALKPLGLWVVASEADSDYDPFSMVEWP